MLTAQAIHNTPDLSLWRVGWRDRCYASSAGKRHAEYMTTLTRMIPRRCWGEDPRACRKSRKFGKPEYIKPCLVVAISCIWLNCEARSRLRSDCNLANPPNSKIITKNFYFRHARIEWELPVRQGWRQLSTIPVDNHVLELGKHEGKGRENTLACTRIGVKERLQRNIFYF